MSTEQTLQPAVTPEGIFGMMAEFEDPDALVHATASAYLDGYREMDAYAPFPVEGLADALGMHRSVVPWLAFIGGITGTTTGVVLQLWTMTFAYPINVGGRPYYSWPSFVPPAYELTILFASLTIVAAMFIVNKLPEPYHPVFNVPAFVRASTDRFFLVIQANDPRFDLTRTRQFLQSLRPVGVFDVPQ